MAEETIETPAEVAPAKAAPEAMETEAVAANGNGDAAADPAADPAAAEPAAEPAVPEVPKVFEGHFSEDVEKIWTALVASDFADFTCWTSTISLIDRETTTPEQQTKLHEIYTRFLGIFPFCYGYWKKYADHAAAREDVDKACAIYERGVAAIAYSVDLWGHYCTFVQERNPDGVDKIRELYERAVTACGQDFNAHLLWNKYVAFEELQEDYTRINALYMRLMDLPSSAIEDYYSRFRHFLSVRPLSEIATAEEIAEFEADIKKETEANAAAAAPAAEGEEEAAAPAPAPSPEEEQTEEEKEAQKKVKLLAKREALYKAGIEKTHRVRPYEMSIKRPYFHVKALDDMQLKNWRAYLDFVEADGVDAAKVVYERCLIACCCYPYYWVRYATFLEKNKDIAGARAVFTRACDTHLTKRAGVFLASAVFEEASGDVKRAREIYQHVLDNISDAHVETVVQFASFEQRHGGDAAAVTIYTNALEKVEGETSVFLSCQLGRITQFGMHDHASAKAVYEKALEKSPEQVRLWKAYISSELAAAAGGSKAAAKKQLASIGALFTRVLDDESKVSADAKVDFARQYVDYLTDFGTSLEDLRTWQTKLSTMVAATKTESKKRPAESSAVIQQKMARTAMHHQAGHQQQQQQQQQQQWNQQQPQQQWNQQQQQPQQQQQWNQQQGQQQQQQWNQQQGQQQWNQQQGQQQWNQQQQGQQQQWNQQQQQPQQQQQWNQQQGYDQQQQWNQQGQQQQPQQQQQQYYQQQ